MSKNRRKQTVKIVKKNAKFSFKLLLWAIPVILGVSIGLTLLNQPTWLIMLANLIVGGATCFIVYIIYDKKQQKKQQQPKKPDPFSD